MAKERVPYNVVLFGTNGPDKGGVCCAQYVEIQKSGCRLRSTHRP